MSRYVVNNLKLHAHIRHAWLAVAAYRRALVSVLILCVLVVGEPLACIIHCQFLMPDMYQHHHTTPMPQDALSLDQASASQAASFVCFMTSPPRTPGDTSSTLPPSPVHEVVMLAIALYGAALLPLACLLDLVRFVPRLVFAPPLRPPIPFAA